MNKLIKAIAVGFGTISGILLLLIGTVALAFLQTEYPEACFLSFIGGLTIMAGLGAGIGVYYKDGG